jgi:large subunit ribosomal protein LX
MLNPFLSYKKLLNILEGILLSTVKIFRVKGRILKPDYKTVFSKDVRALKPEDAIEKVYMLLGGQHHVKRFYLKIDSVKEIVYEDVNDPIIRALSRD